MPILRSIGVHGGEQSQTNGVVIVTIFLAPPILVLVPLCEGRVRRRARGGAGCGVLRLWLVTARPGGPGIGSVLQSNARPERTSPHDLGYICDYVKAKDDRGGALEKCRFSMPGVTVRRSWSMAEVRWQEPFTALSMHLPRIGSSSRRNASDRINAFHFRNVVGSSFRIRSTKCRRAMLRNLLLAVALTLIPARAVAQSDRERGDKACRADVRRLCKSVLDQGDLTILNCLQTNRTKLSGTCTKFLQEVGQLS